MRKLNKKVAAAAAAGIAIAVATGGVALAFWTSTGSGNGSASTSAGASDLTVTETSPVSNMYPGDSAQTLSGTVKNNAANSAYVTAVTAAITGVTKATSAPAGTCDASDYTLATPAMTVNVDLASGATTAFSGATIKFNNKTSTNQDACKGATVALSYTVS